MMWCLRYFLILPFLPFPNYNTPLFSTLFLLSLISNQRPCIYCALLLIGLYFATCNLSPSGQCWISFSSPSPSSISSLTSLSTTSTSSLPISLSSSSSSSSSLNLATTITNQLSQTAAQILTSLPLPLPLNSLLESMGCSLFSLTSIITNLSKTAGTVAGAGGAGGGGKLINKEWIDFLGRTWEFKNSKGFGFRIALGLW